MVRLEGFEPPTPWFVAKYSIQLSYNRIFYLRKLLYLLFLYFSRLFLILY